MKRSMAFLFSFLLIFALAVPAFASSNTDAILSALRSGVEVNGKTVAIPASYVNQAENYFASHQVTDTQANYILSEISAAKATIQSAGVTNLSKLDPAVKRQIISNAQAAAGSLNLKLSIGPDKSVKIADQNGSVVFTGGNPIKTTGLGIDFSGFIWVSAFVLAAAAACLFIVIKKRLFKRVF
ncbi:MAG TPA: hypothetical protein VHO71_05215 [Caproiciproducens sp.]|nr:hypothetical protein [Caproiciproducens sp.]